MALVPAGMQENPLAAMHDEPLSPSGFRHIAADVR
jgi:hypothetical protein